MPNRPGGNDRLGPSQPPHEAIWAPIGYDGARLGLAELTTTPIPLKSEERVAETQAYRRRTEGEPQGEER